LFILELATALQTVLPLMNAIPITIAKLNNIALALLAVALLPTPNVSTKEELVIAAALPLQSAVAIIKLILTNVSPASMESPSYMLEAVMAPPETALLETVLLLVLALPTLVANLNNIVLASLLEIAPLATLDASTDQEDINALLLSPQFVVVMVKLTLTLAMQVSMVLP